MLLVQHHDVAVGQLEVLIVAAADTRHVAEYSFGNPCRERQTERTVRVLTVWNQIPQ